MRWEQQVSPRHERRKKERRIIWQCTRCRNDNKSDQSVVGWEKRPARQESHSWGEGFSPSYHQHKSRGGERSEQEQVRAPLEGFYVAKKKCHTLWHKENKENVPDQPLCPEQPSDVTSFIISTWQLVFQLNINLFHKLITEYRQSPGFNDAETPSCPTVMYLLLHVLSVHCSCVIAGVYCIQWSMRDFIMVELKQPP